MALASVEDLTYSYPRTERPALEDVSLEIEAGETIVLLGASGSGKSTLVRALAGLVPHFHGGRFAGRVEIAGADTRSARPADLAESVASVFQDPEDQVVMTIAANEVAFGLENLGIAPRAIWPRVEASLSALGSLHLRDRRTLEVSAGELQRVCLAGALALEPELLLLDEPTSQLDPEGSDDLVSTLAEIEAAVVLSEQRPERVLRIADRVVFLEDGRVLLDAARDDALVWLAEHRPAYVAARAPDHPPAATRDAVCSLRDVRFAYRPGLAVLDGVDLDVARGEVLALEGPNGVGKTTLGKIAAGLLEPQGGDVVRTGSAGYLLQDPGRYLVSDRVEDEVALAVAGDRDRAREALARVGLDWAGERHPRDLSSGERERVALAAVAVAAPDLLVLDEPTRGVDPERKREIAEWLFAYADEGRGVLVATHDRSFAASRRVGLGAEARVAV